ncbi:MAG: response regulator [Thermodesulfobacteriota bacterium]
MKNLKLRTKLIITVMGIISFMVIPFMVAAQYTFSRALMEEYHQRAALLARYIDTRIMDSLLAGNEKEAGLTLSRIKEEEKDIEYVFIITPEGRVSVSTFAEGVPPGLLRANQADQDLPYNLKHIKTEKGVMLDIAIPLRKGTLGTARIAISEEHARHHVVLLIKSVSAIAVGVLLGGVILALVLARLTTRPVENLREVADAISKGDLEKTAVSDTKDEIGQLAASFNRMTEFLRTTLSELNQIYNGSLTSMRVIDKNYNIISQNRAMDNLTGTLARETVGKKCYEVFPGACCHTDNCSLRMILRGEQWLDREDERKTMEGAMIPCRVMATPFKDGTGTLKGVIEVFTDITESKRFIKELQTRTRNLEESNRIQEAYGAVVTILNSGLEMTPLLYEIIDEIAGYMDAQLGVIYLYTEEDKRLRPAASYALDKEAIEEGFGIGQGLPGQAAEAGKMILVADVPADYFHIASGGGRRLPENIICLPITFHDTLVGVMELASIHAFTEENIKFLRVVASQLGTGINNVISHRKVEELAVVLQDKNELLSSQNEELQAQSEELIAQSEELQAQAEELEAQKKMLEEKTCQVQEADRLKSEFLSNMSHELRTPLNAALGMTRLMADGGAGPLTEKQKGYLEIIKRNGENLLQLINDILDLSRIESGRIEISAGAVHLGMFVNSIAASMKSLFDEKGLSLNIHIDDHLILQNDADKLKQILVNLLGNAVKFTARGGISIAAREETNDDGKKMVKISVTDTGIGLEEKNLTCIFDAFRQIDGSVTRRYGGTGLGLSICWKLSQLLGGRIEVESEFGKGSSFTVILPKELTIAKSPQVTDWKEKVKEALLDDARMQPDQLYKTMQVSKEILIIDDDPIVIRELKALLKDEKYWLRFAFNGPEGLRRIEEHTPDLILLDLQMPEMNGFQVLTKLAADERQKKIPVIILTALDVTKEEKKHFGQNVKGVIVKGGIDKSTLINQLSGVLNVEGPLPEKTDEPRPLPRKRKKALPPFKILIVEDNPDNMILIKETLKTSGYILFSAENGEKGVAVAQKELPDLILMDIQMPGMGGAEASQRIRKVAALRDVPIIALTARAMKGEQEAILEAGLDDYLAKPFSPKDLIDKTARWLG